MDRETRDARIAALEQELSLVRRRLGALVDERGGLEDANAREDWPDGPFTLHYFRYHQREALDYNTPLGAVHRAISIEDSGAGSTEKITDRHGAVIYNLERCPWERLDESYPDLPGDVA